MWDSATVWDSKSVFAGSYTEAYPTSSGWIISPSQKISASSWGVLGGTSTGWKTNAPTITISSPTKYGVAGWINKDSNPNDDNVGYWVATPNVLTTWYFTVTASNASPSAMALDLGDNG